MKLSTLLASILLIHSFSAQVIEKPKEIEPVQVEETLMPPPVEVEEAAGDQIIEITTIEVAGPKAASFPGGPDSLMAYLASQVELFILQDTNDIFPFGEQVFVVFEVGTDGQILNPKVELGYDAFLDSAALRIIRDMPKWEPATNELDEPVLSTNRVTVTFDLFLDEDMSDFEDLEETDQNNFKSHWASFEFGRVNYAPSILGKVHPKFKTPANALLLNMLLGIGALLTGRTAEIITISVFGAITLYIISMITVVALRIKEPGLKRPFRVPLYPAFPLVALTIAIGSLVAMLVYNQHLGEIYFLLLLGSFATFKIFSSGSLK